MRNLVIAILLLLNSTLAVGQDLKTDLTKVQASMKQADTLVQIATAQVYRTYADTATAFSTDNWTVIQSKETVVWLMEDEITFRNKEMMLLIDNDEKVIMYSALPNLNMGEREMSMDSVLTQGLKYAKITSFSTQGDLHIYELTYDKNAVEYKSARIVIDAKAWRLKEMRFLYSVPVNLDNGQYEGNKIPFIVIRYTYPLINLQQKEYMKQKHFLEKSGAGYKPAPAYKNYEMIGQ